MFLDKHQRCQHLRLLDDSGDQGKWGESYEYDTCNYKGQKPWYIKEHEYEECKEAARRYSNEKEN